MLEPCIPAMLLIAAFLAEICSGVKAYGGWLLELVSKAVEL